METIDLSKIEWYAGERTVYPVIPDKGPINFGLIVNETLRTITSDKGWDMVTFVITLAKSHKVTLHGETVKVIGINEARKNIEVAAKKGGLRW